MLKENGQHATSLKLLGPIDTCHVYGDYSQPYTLPIYVEQYTVYCGPAYPIHAAKGENIYSLLEVKPEHGILNEDLCMVVSGLPSYECVYH